MPLIPFNKPFIAGKELYYVAQAVTYGNLSGDGHFTQRCSEFLRDTIGAQEVLMTPSCTAALEMAAILCDLDHGDEVIMPSYTFVSTANAFVRTGATPVFVDIRPDTLNIDDSLIEEAITDRTRAIVAVHYAGIGCEMDRIMTIADRHNLLVVEDAAQAVNARFNERHLGSIGHLGCYSFHETKNYISGEGGALSINDNRFTERARIIRDKGTNRHAFLCGDVDRYTWIDDGSSYVPSELCCAFLWGQLEQLNDIASRRRDIYLHYRHALKPLEAKDLIRLPLTPEDCNSNFHMFFILTRDSATRDALLRHLNSQGINAVIHFVPLHSSPRGRTTSTRSNILPHTEDISARLLRLPFYHDISIHEQDAVVDAVFRFFQASPPSDASTHPNNTHSSQAIAAHRAATQD